METALPFSGKYKISSVNFGFFKLDGGSMFGSVPKNMWNKIFPADEQNRVQLAERSLVIRDGSCTVLIDCGMGDKWNEKLKLIYAVEQSPFPLNPDSITDLVLTHLHFDHAGGISKYNSDKKLIPVFAKATAHVQRENLEYAKNPSPKERASYLAENYSMVELMPNKLIEGKAEIFPAIFVHPIHGHTHGQQWIEIVNGQERIVFPSDLMPTTRHLHPAYHMGYDICAETIINEKEKFLKQVVSANTLVVFQHDPDIIAAKIMLGARGEYQLDPKSIIK
jgi:glyoxylase-like metal-dependent hydrolase (beta-lactamase superfamily II)